MSGRIDVDDFPYVDRVPGIILPFLEQWNDVRADGNCGFRCVADVFHGGQDNWFYARRAISNEIGANPIYEHVYYDGLVRARQRIDWGGGPCGENHYMETWTDLFPIANFYKCAVMCFSLGTGGSLYPCITVLPWESPSTMTKLCTELIIAHLGSYRHYIRLELAEGFPVPPIATLWFEMRDESVIGCELEYEQRRAYWDQLRSRF